MMNRNTRAVIAAASALVLTAGCQTERDDGIFDPRAIGRDEREASTTYNRQNLRPLPTTLQSRFLPNQNQSAMPPEEPTRVPIASPEQTVALPLREIAQRAVTNNYNVKVSGYTPAIDETRITEAEARFDPEFFSSVTFEQRRQAFGEANNEADVLSTETGLRQLLPSGGQVEVSYRPQRVNGAGDEDAEGGFNWTNEVRLQITQPLLRDFGFAINRARITINRNNQRVSLLDFRRDVEELLRNVEENYWRLVQAQQNVRILEELLQRTMDTAGRVRERYGQDVTLEQVSNSIARVESARTNLIRARQRVADLSDQLKNFMNDPDYPVAGPTLILPADKPLESVVYFDFNDSIQTAQANRFELGQQQIRVDSANIALQVAKNNELPQLNLVGSVGTQAVGEDYIESNTELADSHDDISFSIGLQFVQRLGNREARAIFRRAQLQRMQAVDQYRGLIDQVSLDVKIAQREVEASWQSIAQTRATRFAAGKALDVIGTLEEGGNALTPDFLDRKLNRQQELAVAEQYEADAIASYNIAISRFESAKGTILRYNNVVLDEEKRAITKANY